MGFNSFMTLDFFGLLGINNIAVIMGYCLAWIVYPLMFTYQHKY